MVLGGGCCIRESVFNGGGNRGNFEVFVDTGLGGGIATSGETAVELGGQGRGGGGGGRETERGRGNQQEGKFGITV